MYYDFFGFREPPFSIAPDPRYLYLSERHKEALAHLMYGIQGQGGFIVITGEVGTGKTTMSRCFIENVPDHVDIALILNPRLSARELLSSICDELGIAHPAGSTIKRLVDLINQDLLKAHAAGRHKVLMIDEAQNLSADVLEQLRLLTNLETAEKKLLQIVLLGQPELQELLARPELRQLNQRVTARYHLEALDRSEVQAYVRYRISVAGQRGEIFSESAIRALYRVSGGIPRLINLISDRALLGGYAEGEHLITARHIRAAAREVSGTSAAQRPLTRPRSGGMAALAWALGLMVVSGLGLWWVERGPGQTGLEWPMAEALTSGAVVRGANDAGPAGAGESATDTAAPPGPDPAQQAAATPSPWLLASGSERAFARLYAIWNRDYQPGSGVAPCDFAPQAGLGCLQRQGTRRSLEQLDRPAVLQLRDDQGEIRFLTLEQLGGDNALVRSSRGEISLPFAAIEKLWFGEFTVLWQLPPYMTGEGVYGEQNGDQLWLSARLMELADTLTADSGASAQIKSLPLAEQIRWFQGQKGLVVDGIAGAMTLIQVSNELDPGTPRLSVARASGKVSDAGIVEAGMVNGGAN